MVRNQRKMIRPDAAERISDFAERIAFASQEDAVMNREICLSE